jgi:alkylation response protein AidB-like acyl-CoA dehydrogenase
LKTRAVRDGDHWIIRGQKLYTSTASYANYCWLAVRTDPDAKPDHAGISVFIVPMDTPGIQLSPLHGLNEHRSNVVFWDDVRVPHSALVGEVNGGWKAITAALAYERIALAAVTARGRSYFDKLIDYVSTAERNGRPLREDSLVRERMAALAGEIEAARLLSAHTARIVEQGGVPIAEAAMLKIYSGELMERLGETALDLLGSGGSLRTGSPSALVHGDFEFCIRDSLMYVIGGGTGEIQRNIVALRGLGLPR